MSETREEILRDRQRLKTEYGQLFEKVTDLLFRHDPIGINYESNTDEYEAEVGTILPRLKDCGSADDALTVVHEEFRRWFGPDAGGKQKYSKMAEEIWNAWQTRKSL